MKRFLTSTAAALILSTTAYADVESSVFADMKFESAVNLNASDLIGMRVYASESDISNDTVIAADGEKQWDDIGEINEIVLTRSGDVQSVIVGVGGFLGINEKDVAINMDQLQFVSDGKDADDFFLVVKANVAGVKNAPAYQYEKVAPQHRTEAKSTSYMEGERPMLIAPNIQREGFATVEYGKLTTEDLTGARVYGSNDEDLGEIDRLLVTEDGKLDRAIIDVGGLLGLGEHPVAVTMDELQIVRSEDDGEVRVYIESSQEALEKQPEYQS
jgi:hypothetical protein